MNKNGWGLRVELAFILLFVFCLLIATIGIHSLGLMEDKTDILVDLGGDGTDKYNYLENKVSEAGYEYYRSHYPNGNRDEVTVSVDTLVYNGFMSNIYDEDGRSCKGYAKLLPNGNVVSYIKCTRYTTPGY